MSAEKAAPKGRPAATTAAAKQQTDCVTPDRQKRPATRNLAFGTVTTSGRGVERVDLHWRCSVCGRTHASRARGDVPPSIERRGPHGPVTLLVVMASAVAA